MEYKTVSQEVRSIMAVAAVAVGIQALRREPVDWAEEQMVRIVILHRRILMEPAELAAEVVGLQHPMVSSMGLVETVGVVLQSCVSTIKK